MPTNKNALIRYMLLDEVLSNRHHYYDINDLVSIVNDRLIDMDMASVSRRCIEKDLNFLELAPFYVEIERFNVRGKYCIRYKKPSFSIFTKELSTDEENLLAEVLNTIGQFDGLDNFEWLESLKSRLDIKGQRKIISFSNNPYYRNASLLGTLFTYISNKVVVEISHHSFHDNEKVTEIFHPYLLKQYNNRWYIIGATDSDKTIKHIALDRIDSITPLAEYEYYDCPIDLNERFEDIIGVRLPLNREPIKIYCWVSNFDYNYIESKPIHGSQTNCNDDEIAHLKRLYPNLSEGRFIHLECIENYELRRELCSFFDNLIVLEPKELREKLESSINKMRENYRLLRT